MWAFIMFQNYICLSYFKCISVFFFSLKKSVINYDRIALPKIVNNLKGTRMSSTLTITILIIIAEEEEALLIDRNEGMHGSLVWRESFS